VVLWVGILSKKTFLAKFHLNILYYDRQVSTIRKQGLREVFRYIPSIRVTNQYIKTSKPKTFLRLEEETTQETDAFFAGTRKRTNSFLQTFNIKVTRNGTDSF